VKSHPPLWQQGAYSAKATYTSAQIQDVIAYAKARPPLLPLTHFHFFSLHPCLKDFDLTLSFEAYSSFIWVSE
jgi:hypothetical protein